MPSLKSAQTGKVTANQVHPLNTYRWGLSVKLGPRIRRLIAATAIALSSTLVISGCSLIGPESVPTSSAEVTTPTPTEEPEPDVTEEATEVERAIFLAAQYDYETAIEILQPFESPEAKEALSAAMRDKEKTVKWADNSAISHIFFHSLWVDPAQAEGSSSRQGYLDYMVTLDEFNKMLEQIYANDWVLVSPYDISSFNDEGVMTYNDILLPEGKKPLVLSIDDVSYYEYMEGDGFATKLFINSEGKVVNSFTDADGNTTEGAYDMMPVVDEFILSHPDFSYQGAKGIIGLTGYNGILGYRTSPSEYPDSPTLKEDQTTATEVANAMKEDGWLFASHSWGHMNMTTSSMDRINTDSKLWDEEVRPLIGDTDLFIYAFGADIAGLENYSMDNPKFKKLKDYGFDYYFPIDASTPHWMQLTDDSLRQARINVDGLRMGYDKTGKNQALAPFFDIDSVIDLVRSK